MTTRLELCFAATAFAVASLVVAPVATADATDALRAAIPAARGSICGPMRTDPLLDQAAAEINDSTDRYINFTARAVPFDDATPLLKDLGYPVTKSRILQGAASTAANSIKAALLQGSAPTAIGPAVLPDCSLNALGVDARYNAKKDVVLVTAVLAA